MTHTCPFRVPFCKSLILGGGSWEHVWLQKLMFVVKKRLNFSHPCLSTFSVLTSFCPHRLCFSSAVLCMETQQPQRHTSDCVSLYRLWVFYSCRKGGQEWRCTLLVPEHESRRQEDYQELEASLNYLVKAYLKVGWGANYLSFDKYSYLCILD